MLVVGRWGGGGGVTGDGTLVLCRKSGSGASPHSAATGRAVGAQRQELQGAVGRGADAGYCAERTESVCSSRLSPDGASTRATKGTSGRRSLKGSCIRAVRDGFGG